MARQEAGGAYSQAWTGSKRSLMDITQEQGQEQVEEGGGGGNPFAGGNEVWSAGGGGGGGNPFGDAGAMSGPSMDAMVS